MAETSRLDAELAKLRSSGLVLPRHTARAMQAYGEGYVTNQHLGMAADHDLHKLGATIGRTITDADYRSPEVQRLMQENQALTRVMGQRRGLGPGNSRVSREKRLDRLYPNFPKTATLGGGMASPMGGDVYTAIPRFYDPLEYWDLSGLPWNVADEGHRHKLHKWLRLYYATHYLVPILIDIFTRFPLVGLELEHKDPALVEIYEDIFLNQLRYDDFLVSLGREFWCALPGELVQTHSGVKAIEEITEGDRVLTHRGEVKSVLGASSREYAGQYVELRPHYGLPMQYTYGHPFLVRRQGEVKWIPTEELTVSDQLYVPVDQREEDRQEFSVWETLIDWLPVPSQDQIDKMEIPAYVRWTNSVTRYRSYIRRMVSRMESNGYVPGSVWRRDSRYTQHSPLPATFVVDEDFLWFVGLYLAEGSVSKDGVLIDLHVDEREYAERVATYAAGLGLNATVNPIGENGLRVIVYSISFGAFIKSLLGSGWHGKRIPEWMMVLPPAKQAHLVRGYFDGDGNYHDIRVKATSGSLNLILQMERMVRRLGVVTTINQSTSTTANGTDCIWWDMGPCLADTNRFMKAIGYEASYPERRRDFAVWDGPGYWVKVFRLRHGHYEGPVYNFEVEEDHSYVGSVATHNCVGEAFPLGSFDEDLGIWEHEELINPEDVVIDNFPLLGTQQLKIVPPDYLRRIAQTQSPAREWYMLQEQYEDLIPYLLKGEHIPISPVMIRQVANKLNDWDDHGTPILMRGLRTLLHEEKLLASQDAIAERLYSPFILAKLGIMDMGDGLPPWIPTPEEVQSVRDDIDIAMSSDFRVLVHHFGLEMTSVFGREQMPRLGDDFDRIERRLMQVFGINPSLLSAGSNAQPYASSALQAEFMNQILRTFQKMLKDHFRERAMVVAEAQEHYDYERRGQTRVPIYETVVEWDEEGNKHLVRKPKLTCPDLVFACLALGTRINTPHGPVATEALRVGDEVIAWDLTNDQADLQVITHSYDNGTQNCYRVITKMGREIVTTPEHPFLTTEGWVEAQDLAVTDKLRVATNVSAFRIPDMTERDARFLGLMCGDGCVSQCENGGVPMIANTDEEILRWTNNYVGGFGCSLKAKNGECSHDITQNDQRVNPNPLKALLRRNGLTGHTAHTKRVPASVWAGGPGVWAAFLSGYLDADGTVKCNTQVAWDSRNQPLLKDCQDLLAFLGVRASLVSFDTSKWPDPQGKYHDGVGYRLIVCSKESLNQLQRVLDPLCIRKQKISDRVQAVDERRSLSPAQAQEIKDIVETRQNRFAGPTYREIGLQYGVSASTVWRAIQGEYDDLIATWVDPAWDEIESIALEPHTPTWSLGVAAHHTHITEGLVTHNTFDLRDEATERQFLMGLRGAGVPIPDDKLMIGVSWKKDDYIEQYNRDVMRKTISQQRAKMDTYIACVIQGLPVPMDLKYEVESVLSGGTGPEGAPPGGPEGGESPGGMSQGMGGHGGPMGGPSVFPPPPPGLLGPGGSAGPDMAPGGGPPPAGPTQGGPPGNVPPVSNERRQGLQYNTPFKSHVEGSLATDEELADLTSEWPEDMRRRAVAIRDAVEVAGGFIPGALASETHTASDIVDSQETDDPGTWILKANQKVEDLDGEKIILESKKKRVDLPIEPAKRYSIIDPLAESLDEAE